MIEILKIEFLKRMIVLFVAAFLFLTFNVCNVYAVCKNGTADNVLDTIEICDVGGAGIIPAGHARGGATHCSDLGDTNPATSTNNLRCTTICTIDYALSGCSGGFQGPPAPPNVPVDFNTAIMNLTNWILGFVAMIAVLALIWGGVNYLTSAGNEDQAKTGKKVIEYALMGLVIAGLAYAVVVVIITVIL